MLLQCYIQQKRLVVYIVLLYAWFFLINHLTFTFFIINNFIFLASLYELFCLKKHSQPYYTPVFTTRMLGLAFLRSPLISGNKSTTFCKPVNYSVTTGVYCPYIVKILTASSLPIPVFYFFHGFTLFGLHLFFLNGGVIILV